MTLPGTADGNEKAGVRMLWEVFDWDPRQNVSRKLVEALRQRLMSQIEEARNLKNQILAVSLLHPQGEIDFDSSVWEKSADITSFGLTGKKRGAKASVDTSARVFHDSENLWIRVRCDDPSIGELSVCRGRAGVKEEVPEADHLEFYARDVRDWNAYYLFSLTPDGVWADLKGYDGSWNGEWRREERRTARGVGDVCEVAAQDDQRR